MYREDVEAFLEEALNILKRAGFIADTISYPKNKRSIDVVGVRGDKKIVMKITIDTRNLSSMEYHDLRKASKAYSAAPIIVSEKDNREDIEEDVVVKRNGLNIIGIELLKNYLLSGEKPLVYKLRGSYLVRINPRKFHEKRLSYGYSLGELAEYLGVSRKAVYDYERGKISVSIETAIRIAETLGEDVFEPIDLLSIINEDFYSVEILENKVEEELYKFRLRENYEFFKLSKTPVDYVIKSRDSVVSIVYRGEKDRDFKTKVHEALRISRILQTKEYILRDLRDLELLRMSLIRGHQPP